MWGATKEWASPGTPVAYFNDCFAAIRLATPKGLHFAEGLKEVEELTLEQAAEVIRMARRCLAEHLLCQETHEHMDDDCGDYLAAATWNWNRLFHLYWDNDGDEQVVLEGVKDFLRQHPLDWEATDGEIRYSLFPDSYVESYSDDAA